MKKYTMKRLLTAYLCAVLCAAALVVCVGISFGGVYRTAGGNSTASVKTIPAVADKDVDGAHTFTLTLPEGQAGTTLGFFSNHQRVEVWYEGTLVYSLSPRGGLLGHTTGSVWNFAALGDPAQGEQVVVRFYPLYASVENSSPTFYFGRELLIYRLLMKSSLIGLLIALMNGVLGVMLMLYWFFISRKVQAERRGMLFLGMFAILAAMWSGNETTACALLISNRAASSLTAFLLLDVLPLPFVLYVRDEFGDEHGVVWRILCWACLANTALGITLQLADIVDMHDMVLASHLIIVVALFYLFYMLSRERNRDPIKRGLHLLGVGALGVGVLSDIIIFYVIKRMENDIFGNISFFLYVSILGATAARDSRAAINKGREADIYRRLALYDSLTDMMSRNAFDNDMRGTLPAVPGTAVATFDLNDLKKRNDRFGHHAGDKALARAARMIEAAFGRYGRCYRIGGDEFCVVVENASPQKLDDMVERLKELEQTQDITQLSGEPVTLACGYAIFDPLQDKTLEDTRGRADGRLYRNKKQMKADVQGAAAAKETVFGQKI